MRWSERADAVKRVLTVVVVVVTMVVVFVGVFVLKPYRLNSASMLPTIHIGQRVLVDRFATHPGIGTIVVFHPPAGADSLLPVCGDPHQGFGDPVACDQPTVRESRQVFIERVVGLPGDRLLIEDGHVIRNGRRENAPYARTCDERACSFAKVVTVPRGDDYLIGDNRGDSDDSRFWGPVPRRWIIGTAFFTYWPLNRIGTL